MNTLEIPIMVQTRMRALSGNSEKSPLPKAYLDNLLESKKNKKNSALAKIIKEK